MSAKLAPFFIAKIRTMAAKGFSAKQIAACLGFSDQWVRNHASRNKIRLLGRKQKHSRVMTGSGDDKIKAIAAQEGRDNTCVVHQATPEELAEFAHITALKKAEYVEKGDWAR